MVANSDSQEDQDLKLQVRDAIVQQLNGVMGELDSCLLYTSTTGRFKSACLSCSFLRPLRRTEAAKNALLANVLIQGTEDHPDLQSISQALDSLYGCLLYTSRCV